jgi:hypothetical protein
MKLLISAAVLLLLMVPRSYGCATADLIQLLHDNGGAVSALQGRPEMQRDWASPYGIFRIHFDIIGDRAVYHPEEDIDPPDGVPDYVNRVADYLALAYDSLIVSLGFDPPPSDGQNGGDQLYDIYLTDYSGLTTPEEQSDQYPGRPAYTSFIQIGHDLRIPPYGDDPYPYLKATCAHEFFHAIEFAYRTYSEDVTPWWFEACANWAEEKVFDDLNYVYFSLPYYLSYPFESLYQTNGQFVYGAWLVPEYLEERQGTSFIIGCWEKFAQFDFAIEALEYTFIEHNLDYNNEYCLHVIWNYFTGPNYHPGFYSEAALFNTTVRVARIHDSYPVDWVGQPDPLQNLSSDYIVFQRQSFSKGSLIIEYLNPTDDRQIVCLAIVRSSGRVQIIIRPGENRAITTFQIPEIGGIDKVVLAPVWAFEGSPRQGSTLYEYMAYIDTAAISVTEDIEPAKDYSLTSAYPNPFNGAVTISFNAPRSEVYNLYIYDIMGRLIHCENNVAKIGSNSINWATPANLSSGMLFYVIDFQTKKLYGKMSLLK